MPPVTVTLKPISANSLTVAMSLADQLSPAAWASRARCHTTWVTPAAFHSCT